MHAEFGAVVAQGRIFGGWRRKLHKMHANDTVLKLRRMRKNMFFGKNMEKFIFGAFLTDDISMTSLLGPGTIG